MGKPLPHIQLGRLALFLLTFFVWKAVSITPLLESAYEKATWPPTRDYLQEFVLPVFLASAILFAVHYISGMSTLTNKKQKPWGVRLSSVPGPLPAVALRHARFLALLETPFQGGDTVPSLFELSVQRFASKPFLGTRQLLKREVKVDEKSGRTFEKLTLGDYEWQTFSHVFSRVTSVSRGLSLLGHKQTRVAMFAETRAEWYIALQAALRQNLTVVTVYASLGEDALVHSLNETGVSCVVCDSKQWEKVCAVGSQLHSVLSVVVMEELQVQGSSSSSSSSIEGEAPNLSQKHPKHWKVVSFGQLEQLGRQAEVGEAAEPPLPSPSDTAVIMYTSGSTGVPKGVMMSHGNLVATIAGVMAVVPNAGPTDVYLAYLPLAHVLELAAEVGMAALGASVGYGSPLTLTDNSSKVKAGTKGDARALSPTLMAAVPAILDRIRDGVRKKVDTTGGFAKKVFEYAYNRRLSTVNAMAASGGGSLLHRMLASIEARLWTAVVFGKVRSAIGGRVRFMLSGGAPLSADTQRFMNVCFGCPIGQGYGLTETCAGGTFTDWKDLSVGRVGPPIPCSLVKLIDWEEGGYRITDEPLARGEICIGGPCVTQGYFNNPDKTAEDYHTDTSGMRWFHTGDIGQFHLDGTVEIVDRKKDIIKLQAGEYVSLGKVESVLQASPLVENIMMHADPSQSYAVALVVPARDPLLDWAKENQGGSDDFETLCNSKEANAAVMKSLTQVAKGAKLERFEIPQKIKLLHEPWTPESGFVTSALKLKRDNVKKAFGDFLMELYS